MSQTVVEADFIGETPNYISDSRRYAHAKKDEWTTITGNKYIVLKKEHFVVVRNDPWGLPTVPQQNTSNNECNGNYPNDPPGLFELLL